MAKKEKNLGTMVSGVVGAVKENAGGLALGASRHLGHFADVGLYDTEFSLRAKAGVLESISLKHIYDNPNLALKISDKAISTARMAKVVGGIRKVGAQLVEGAGETMLMGTYAAKAGAEEFKEHFPEMVARKGKVRGARRGG